MTTTNCDRRWYIGFAPYRTFFRNELPMHSGAKWNRLLKRKRLPSRSMGLKQIEGYLFVLHEADDDLVFTRLATPIAAAHEKSDFSPECLKLLRKRVVAYPKAELEDEGCHDEVAEKLHAMVTFKATVEELSRAQAALKLRHLHSAHDWGAVFWAFEGEADF